MQHPLEPMAALMTWAAKNTAYNLEFIPEDRLAWKPAPTANSAYEIIQHVCGAINGMKPVLSGGEWSLEPQPLPTTLREAQDQLVGAAEEYVAALRAVNPADLGRVVKIGDWVEFPLARAASMPVVDLVHHHGQIAYLQTLLGDVEFHFIREG